MTKRATPKRSAAAKSPVIVFGLDQAGKPKAGRFPEKHATVARKAAKVLNLAVCAISRPKLIELAPRIPVGRLHAQGKAFIPNIKQALFDELQGAIGQNPAMAAASKPGPSVSAMPEAKPPKDRESITAGDLVLYQEAPKDGWWESVVLQRDGDSLTLRYRDFPRYPAFKTTVRSVALMYADQE
jgi:hypothetical protein